MFRKLTKTKAEGGKTVFPELIKLLAYHRMNHTDLSKILGITQQATSRKVKGESEFKQSEMVKVRNYFRQFYPGITIDQIFTENIFLPQ